MVPQEIRYTKMFESCDKQESQIEATDLTLATKVANYQGEPMKATKVVIKTHD